MLKRVEYEYNKIGEKGFIELSNEKIDIKHCKSGSEKSMCYDSITRVFCDNFNDIQVVGAVGMPTSIKAVYDEVVEEYDENNSGYQTEEFYKVITTEGTTLRTYLINEDKSDEINSCCGSSFYNQKINEYFYRLVETKLKFLYSGVSVVYESDRIRLKYPTDTEDKEKEVIYLVYALLAEVILCDCSVYIVSDNLVETLGVDTLRKFKRIINGLTNVKKCVCLY